jgi:hypothetical protein
LTPSIETSSKPLAGRPSSTNWWRNWPAPNERGSQRSRADWASGGVSRFGDRISRAPRQGPHQSNRDPSRHSRGSGKAARQPTPAIVHGAGGVGHAGRSHLSIRTACFLGALVSLPVLRKAWGRGASSSRGAMRIEICPLPAGEKGISEIPRLAPGVNAGFQNFSYFFNPIFKTCPPQHANDPSVI